MATLKPISTISYNTEAFLKEKLDGLVKAHVLQAYMYICHKGEDGDKNHIHLRVEPNKKLDPMSLTDTLTEYEKGKDKPRVVRPWRNSKEEDWVLYAVHDKEYLDLKYGGGEKGEKIPYEWQAIKANDTFDTETAYIRARASLRHSTTNLATRMQNGENAFNLVLQGENAFAVNAIMRTMNMTEYEKLNAEYCKLQKKLDELLNALNASGVAVEADETGKLVITLPDK